MAITTQRATRRAGRTSARAFLAAALILAPPAIAGAQTTSPQPPLGILIAPSDGVPTQPEQAPSAAPATRPLGVLLGPGPAPAAPSPALPTNPFGQGNPFSAGTEPDIHQPASDASERRPLGLLMGPDPRAAVRPVTTAPASPTRARPSPPPSYAVDQPGPAVPAPPDASPGRPLGTLFGQRPEPLATPAPTAAPLPLDDRAAPSPEPPSAAPDEEPPVRFVADEMSVDRERGIISATGNVEVRFGDRRLVADKIVYDQNKDVATASGNVTLIEPAGERLFGDRMEISGDLKDAVIFNIGMILKDRSRIAGTGARRSDGKVTELRKGVYSPCKLCSDNPNAPPLWQLKAVKVIHDKDQKVVEYRDVWLEFFGVPVVYAPYFRHPDPTVERKTGFLFPKFGSSSDFGTIVETPFFWAISDQEDLTFRPILMTEEAPVLAGQYRKRFLSGAIDVDTSITDNTDDEFSTSKGEFGVRGHIDAEGRFDLNRTWRWGFDLERASDDTYLRRYGFASPSSLNSQLYVEGFRGRNYVSAKSLAFQGLQETDDIDESPVVLPLIDYSHVGARDRLGGRFLFDANFLALTRAKGTDTRRLALHPKWERPFQGPFGDLYRFEAGVNMDVYHVNSLSRSGEEDYTGVSQRVFPYANLEWRLPLVRTEGTIRQTLEPIASIAMAPNGGNSNKIPNEDSTDFEFDETNLFSVNRFSGIDRVEGGPRINYGLKWGVFGRGTGSTTVFIGQTYRLRTDSTFAAGSGLEDNFSDIVGSVSISPASRFNLQYRTRFSSDDFSPNRNEVQFSAGVPAFNVAGNYTFLDQQEDSEFAGREELSLSANSVINRFWRTRFTALSDLDSSEMRSIAFEATYENECAVFTTRLSRTFFEDRDLKPTDAITFQLVLKTLGEVRSGASISSN